MENKTLDNALNELFRTKNKMVELVIEKANLDYKDKEALFTLVKRYTNTYEFICVVKDQYWSDKEGINEFIAKLYKVFYALHGEEAVLG